MLDKIIIIGVMHSVFPEVQFYQLIALEFKRKKVFCQDLQQFHFLFYIHPVWRLIVTAKTLVEAKFSWLVQRP
jgi:hypothetical protein